MAIEKRGYGADRHYVLVCDHCGDEAGDFDDFGEAVECKREYGFHSTRASGFWEDVCEDCWDRLNQHRNSSAADDFADIAGGRA